MIEVVISALLPITVILLLGFFAGFHHDFNKDQASILNKMVMTYALPLTLFSGLVTSSFEEIIQQKDLALGLFIGMIVFYFVVYIVARYVFKRDMAISALLALAIAGPAVPFVGVPVLGTLFGTISSVPVAIASIYMNLIQVPLTIILLSMGGASSDGKQTEGKAKTFYHHIVEAVQKPVVWAPLLALVFVLLKIKFPSPFISSFDLLGKATGGVALFASGVVLFSYKVRFNKTVLTTVFAKNILIPFAIWGIVYFLGFPIDLIKETVLTMAIPTASIVIILSIQYNSGQEIFSSVLFLSTILSVLTMGLFIAIL